MARTYFSECKSLAENQFHVNTSDFFDACAINFSFKNYIFLLVNEIELLMNKTCFKYERRR